MVEFNVDFNFSKSLNGLKKLNDSVVKLNQSFFGVKKYSELYLDRLTEQSNKVNEQIANLQQQLILNKGNQKVIDEIQKKLDEAQNTQQQIAMETEIVNTKLQQVNKQADAFATILSEPGAAMNDWMSRIPLVGGMLSKIFRTPLEQLNDMNNSFMRFNQAVNVINRAGGLQQAFSGFFQNFSSNIKLFSKNFKQVFGAGTKALVSNLGVAFSGVATSISSLIPVLASIAAPITGIVFALYTLKKIWELNIGGIQKGVFSVVGVFRDVLGRTVVNFQKALQKLGPLFKIVLTPVFTLLKGLGILLGGLFDAIFEAINPVLDALNEIFAPFAELTGQTEGSITIFKALAAVLKVVGKILGFVFKLALTPLRLMINLAKKLEPVFSKVRDVIVDMLKPFEFIIKAVGKVAKFLGLVEGKKEVVNEINPAINPATAPVTNVQTTSQRNVTVQPVITVNTSREITSSSGREFANVLSREIARQAGAS